MPQICRGNTVNLEQMCFEVKRPWKRLKVQGNWTISFTARLAAAGMSCERRLVPSPIVLRMHISASETLVSGFLGLHVTAGALRTSRANNQTVRGFLFCCLFVVCFVVCFVVWFAAVYYWHVLIPEQLELALDHYLTSRSSQNLFFCI